MFEARLDYMVNFRSVWPGKSICCINSIYAQNKCTRAETGGPERGRFYPLGHADQKAQLTASSQPLPAPFFWCHLVLQAQMSTAPEKPYLSPQRMGGGEEAGVLGLGTPVHCYPRPGAKGKGGQAAHAFYDLATSQNSKQRGKQLAPEPSGQRRS